MAIIDLVFPVQGTTIPTDHLYVLYAALSRLVPAFHSQELPLRFAPIPGQWGGKGLIRLYEGSRLRFRLPAQSTRMVLPLAGKALALAGHRIRLGVPHVEALIPAATLGARIVTFKHSIVPSRFLEVARQKLDELHVRGEATIPQVQSGERRGEPRRQVLRLKGKRVIGFAPPGADFSDAERR